jgi:putative transposase
MKDMAEQNRRLKKMYAEMSMQNDLLKESLGKKRQGRLRGER